MSKLPTKEEFVKYEDVRAAGAFNMIMNASQAALAAGLSRNRYWEVLKNYDELRRRYPRVRQKDSK